MSEEQLKAFLEKVKADTSLQEKLKAAADAEAVAAIAKEAGFSISADDLTTKAQSKLSDEELEDVAGGVNFGPLKLGTANIAYCTLEELWGDRVWNEEQEPFQLFWLNLLKNPFTC